MMPVAVEWHNAEKTILLVTITPPMTWDMYDAGVDEALAQADSVGHRVDIVLNPGSTPLPSGSALPHFKRAAERLPPNVELLVSIITNLIARTMSTLAGQIYLGHRFKYAGSVEQALEIIHKLRAEAETAPARNR
jgi:hypothetical protein